MTLCSLSRTCALTEGVCREQEGSPHTTLMLGEQHQWSLSALLDQLKRYLLHMPFRLLLFKAILSALAYVVILFF